MTKATRKLKDAQQQGFWDGKSKRPRSKLRLKSQQESYDKGFDYGATLSFSGPSTERFRLINPDDITDRAKRYRAQRNAPAGKKRCTFCASKRNTVLDHITGNESDGNPENLMRLCKSCNTRKGLTQARNFVGIRTRQYNPARVPSFTEFRQAAAVLLGIDPGDVAKATQTVRSIPPETRELYADKIEAANPFKSDAQRRKFFSMAARGEISRAVLDKFIKHNPTAPTFAQYAHGVSIHQRGSHDEGGTIIHATPPALRKTYARKIARIKKERR